MGATPAPSGALAERAIANVAATPAPAPTRPSKTLGDATVTDGPSIDATVSGTVSESGAGSGAASELRAALAGIRVSTTEVAPPPPRTWRLPIVLALVGVALAGLAVALYLAFGR